MVVLHPRHSKTAFPQKTYRYLRYGGSRATRNLVFLAGGQGFEPWLADPESAVLPLDDPPEQGKCITICAN